MRHEYKKILLSAFVFLVFFAFSYFYFSEVFRFGNFNFYRAEVGQVSPNFSETEDSEEVILMFVGDIMLSRYIGELMEREDNWNLPFILLETFFSRSDVLFGNLESPISNRGEKTKDLYTFRADPRSIQGLKFAGFDILSFANNHVWDYGEEAFLDTLSFLEEAEILYVGAGKDFKEAHASRIIEVKGNKIAFLSYTNLLPDFLLQENSEPAVSLLRKDLIEADIKNLKENNLADFIVVSFHWGDEYEIYPNAFQKEMARFTIDSGANLVVGHHPHVIQPTEEYNGGLINYSLGNFVFDQNFNDLTSRGFVLEVLVSGEEITDFFLHEVRFNSMYQPYLVEKSIF